jgi:hypothetical protein
MNNSRRSLRTSILNTIDYVAGQEYPRVPKGERCGVSPPSAIPAIHQSISQTEINFGGLTPSARRRRKGERCGVSPPSVIPAIYQSSSQTETNLGGLTPSARRRLIMARTATYANCVALIMAPGAAVKSSASQAETRQQFLSRRWRTDR